MKKPSTTFGTKIYYSNEIILFHPFIETMKEFLENRFLVIKFNDCFSNSLFHLKVVHKDLRYSHSSPLIKSIKTMKELLENRVLLIKFNDCFYTFLFHIKVVHKDLRYLHSYKIFSTTTFSLYYLNNF